MTQPPAFALLSSLPTARQEAFIQALPRIRFDHDSVIFDRHDTTQDVYFILEGATKSVTYGPDGNMAYFKLRKAGDVFGYYSAISGEPRTARMIAVGQTVLGKMSGPDFMDMILSHRAMSAHMLQLVMALLRSETDRITTLITMDARERLAAELISLAAGDVAPSISLPSRNELAARLGMTRETLARHLSAFVQDGLIRLDKDRVQIIDAEGLQALL